jgi:hypothetical protein
MDLTSHLNLAGNALLGMLNPEREFLPTGGYEIAHDLGRWWDAVLRLEEATGFVIPAELEAASLRNLHALTGNPDRLLMVWSEALWLTERGTLNPHNFRETLLAFGGLARRRKSAWAADSAMRLVRSMDRALASDGSFDFRKLGSWGLLPHTTDPSHAEPRRDAWFDGTATSGRSLEALVWLYETLREPIILDVASRIAEHHLAYSTSADGTIHREILDPENVGHCHSFHGTMRGLLLFGLLTGQRRFVDTVEATYRNGIRNRIVKESGWAPHDLGKDRFNNEFGDPVTDPASTGDSAQLALWLALDAGCVDFLDDVERLVRARLVPVQFNEADAACHHEPAAARKLVGAWPIHGPSHAGKGCTPDVLAAVTHTLCDIKSRICTRTSVGIRVDLHFDYEDADVTITSARAEQGRLTVLVKRAESILVRIPGWVPEASLQLRVDGRETPVRRLGMFCWVPRTSLQERSQVVLTYGLPERESEEVMPSGRSYRFQWRGDEIIGVSPQDGPFPFYPTFA